MNNKILFLDESGDHDLIHIDKKYPIFALGGCIVDYNYNKEVLEPTVKKFKRSFFGTEEVILHTREVVRNLGYFKCLEKTEMRTKFYNEINLLMDELDYTVVAGVIKKKELTLQYIYPLDPYFLSLNFIIERFVYYLNKHDSSIGEIIAESRNKMLDNLLDAEYKKIYAMGTDYCRPKEIKEKITNFTIKEREENIIGLQLADLIISPIGRFVLKKRIHEDFKIIEKKFLIGNFSESYLGYGLKIFP
jgi:oligoribonuclease NrnB/cAMP/cGMP phosphodiesterase (DHH superfamily)